MNYHRTETDPVFCAMQTQTQIVSAVFQPPSVLVGGHEIPCGDAYLNVCLCDVSEADLRVFANWAFCKRHNSAVKLASMAERVLLHVKNERGEIVPMRGEA